MALDPITGRLILPSFGLDQTQNHNGAALLRTMPADRFDRTQPRPEAELSEQEQGFITTIQSAPNGTTEAAQARSSYSSWLQHQGDPMGEVYKLFGMLEQPLFMAAGERQGVKDKLTQKLNELFPAFGGVTVAEGPANRNNPMGPRPLQILVKDPFVLEQYRHDKRFQQILGLPIARQPSKNVFEQFIDWGRRIMPGAR